MAIFAAVLVGFYDLPGRAALAEDHSGVPATAATCRGERQSPIDLGGALPARGAALALDYTPFDGELHHRGHTLEVMPRAGSAGGTLVLGNDRYNFVQFHFHHPSEHALAGKRWPMEMHIVHRAADGRLVVLGIMLRPGRENGGIAALLKAMPHSGGALSLPPMELGQFMPAGRAHFSYEGSLTTPPCSEIVQWIVFRDPIEAAPGQITALARAFPMNARPLQPSHGRPVGLDLF
ncbi:carbonic anhydrase [Dongia mobilis]|nr:carbonic anhydrase family protein [Dongia mobilis]